MYADFSQHTQKVTTEIKRDAKKMGEEMNRPYIYLNSPKIGKEETAKICFAESPIKEETNVPWGLCSPDRGLKYEKNYWLFLLFLAQMQDPFLMQQS